MFSDRQYSLAGLDWRRGIDNPFGNAAYMWAQTTLALGLHVTPLLVTIKAEIDLLCFFFVPGKPLGFCQVRV